MKKSGVLLATMAILLLIASSTTAQMKTVYTGSYDYVDYMVCTDDLVTGTESYIVSVWNNKYQFRYEGTYVGESGKEYSWRLVQNWNWKTYKGKAYTETNTAISIIKCEGVPIAMAKTTYHISVNAQGEVTVEFDNGTGEWICL
ncbi:hypothetical protein [Maribellus sediminis]|uniref:hypothetical protein n=1 Tax=Maribellus sediminis TaxID=2696285 RepID=UPI00142F911B|nr:hypothetical protein [Maribellus sediminis]